jgi:hypothetical protein
VDGVNKTFYTLETRLASGYTACDEDEISGYYVNCSLEKNPLTISITDSTQGEISVADENGDALESCICQIYVTYSTKTSAFTDHLFRKAVAYLAAREVVLRFNELDKATLADLPSNRLASPERMLKQYKQTIRKIKAIRVGGI